MTTHDPRQLDMAQKREVSTAAEQTRPGPVFSPAVDIFEDENQITVLADMPGVTTSNLEIDLREGVLTLRGRVGSPGADNEQQLLSEWTTGVYMRQFSVADSIDQAGIQAVLTDGVLRLSLPKLEAAKPRKIKVRTS